MTQSHWRTIAQRVIAQVIKNNPTASKDNLKRLIDAAYPFGSRELHPYKIWLDERAKAFRQIGIPTNKKPSKRDQARLDQWQRDMDQLKAWNALRDKD